MTKARTNETKTIAASVYRSETILRKTLAKYLITSHSSPLITALMAVFRSRSLKDQIEIVGEEGLFREHTVRLLEHWKVDYGALKRNETRYDRVIKIPQLKDRSNDLPNIVSFIVHRLKSQRKIKPTQVTGEIILFLAGFTGWKNTEHLRQFLEQSLDQSDSKVLTLPDAISFTEPLFDSKHYINRKGRSLLISRNEVPYLQTTVDELTFWSTGFLGSAAIDELLGLENGYGSPGHKFSIQQIGQLMKLVQTIDSIDRTQGIGVNDETRTDDRVPFLRIEFPSTEIVSRIDLYDSPQLRLCLDEIGFDPTFTPKDRVYVNHLECKRRLLSDHFELSAVESKLSEDLSPFQVEETETLPILRIKLSTKQVWLNQKEVILAPRKLNPFDALVYFFREQKKTGNKVPSLRIAKVGNTTSTYALFKNKILSKIIKSAGRNYSKLMIDMEKSEVS